MSRESSLRPLLRLLGSQPRLRLLIALAEPPLTVADLADVVGISESSARYHLHKLEEAGLLDADQCAVPRQYRPSGRVQIVRSGGKTVCSIEAVRSEKIIFTIPNTKSPHKTGKRR